MNYLKRESLSEAKVSKYRKWRAKIIYTIIKSLEQDIIVNANLFLSKISLY